MDIAKQKLKQAKQKAKLYAFDYDGTIHDSKYSHNMARELMQKIIGKNKHLAIITARASSAIKTLYPALREFYEKENIKIPMFIAGGNGTILYEIKKGELNSIYSNGLNLEEVRYILKEWNELYSEMGLKTEDLKEKGITIFKDFLTQDWKDYIPNEILDSCRSFDGLCFTEEAKVTFVLPTDESRHSEVVNKMQEILGDEYSIKAGNEIFCHITKALKEDAKKVAVKSILKLLNLNEDEVVAFGDMPHGNDAGLLSFPYSFTNYKLDKVDNTKEPYYLLESQNDPVGAVYSSINYLLN